MIAASLLWRRGRGVALACFLVTSLGRAAAARAAPAELDPLTVGRCTVVWTPANGLSLSYDGVPVVRGSTLNIVKAGWTGKLLGQSDATRVVTPWADAPGGGKTARVTVDNENAVCAYTFTLAPGDVVTVDLAYRLKTNVPAEIEYAAAHLSGPVLQGATVREGGASAAQRVAVAPPPAGQTQEENRLGPPFTQIVFASRLADLTIAYTGDAPRPIIFDARSEAQSWAQSFPVFWMGIGSPPPPVSFADGERRATFRFAFTRAAALPLPPIPPMLPPGPPSLGGEEGVSRGSVAWAAPESRLAGPTPPKLGGPGGSIGGLGGSVGGRATLPDAYAPVLSQAPLVVPQPKQLTLTNTPFRVNDQTRIVIGDGASVRDKVGAELLRKELNEIFGVNIRLVRARDVVQAINVIALGEPGKSALLDRLLSAEKIAPPPKPEGYTIAVTPRAVIAAGFDRAGALWAAQTVIQLLGADASGVQVRPVRITDWPTLSLRAVHLFHGRTARPFHEKLIDRVLSRFKMNALFLQAEQIRWDADPAVAPVWAGSKADVAAEIAFAGQRGLVVYPLVQSYGHLEWLLGKPQNRQFAEDPATPYALNITDARAVAYLEKFNAEAAALFASAPGFHAGLDEVTMRGRFPLRSAPRSFADLFIANARHWHDFFARRGKRMWMWADMALHPSEAAPGFGTAPTPADAAQVRAGLPKDVILVDWQYGAHQRFPSLKLLKDAGFDKIVAATWFQPANIQNFSRAAAEAGAVGGLQTTWAGYESKEQVLDTPQRQQFAAFVLAADYFWNGGAGPAPRDLSYDWADVFTQQMARAPVRTRARAGVTLDLAPLATATLPDWLGYGASNGPSGFPAAAAGTRLLDGVVYALDGRVVLLTGKLNAPGTSHPASRTIPLAAATENGAIVGQQAPELRFALAASHWAAPGTKIGSINVEMEGGKTYVLDLVYGRNIAAPGDQQSLPQAALLWQGKTATGEPFVLRGLSWTNPNPDLPVRAITFTSAGGESAPALFAITILEGALPR